MRMSGLCSLTRSLKCFHYNKPSCLFIDPLNLHTLTLFSPSPPLPISSSSSLLPSLLSSSPCSLSLLVSSLLSLSLFSILSRASCDPFRIRWSNYNHIWQIREYLSAHGGEPPLLQQQGSKTAFLWPPCGVPLSAKIRFPSPGALANTLGGS